MIVLLQLIAIGVFALIGVNLWNASRRGRIERDAAPQTIEGVAEPAGSPGGRAAALLKAFENARADLKAAYPATFAMLGGYLNVHTMNEAGGVEGAVKEMLADWTARKEEVTKELTRLLAENETEEEVRAIVIAACEATFEEEGYRKWMIWLLGRFNAI